MYVILKKLYTSHYKQDMIKCAKNYNFFLDRWIVVGNVKLLVWRMCKTTMFKKQWKPRIDVIPTQVKVPRPSQG